MVDCAPSPSDQGEPDRRLATHVFLSHLHSKPRTSALYRTIDTNGDTLFFRDQAPDVPQGWKPSAPKHRPLAVAVDTIQRGDIMTRTCRTDGQGGAHRQHEEAGDASSTCSYASSTRTNAAARLSRDRTAQPLGETLRFRGSTIRGSWPRSGKSPDGNFTFRCSPTMQKTRASNESAEFDLVGSVLCGLSDSPMSSISSRRGSGKRFVCSWSSAWSNSLIDVYFAPLRSPKLCGDWFFSIWFQEEGIYSGLLAMPMYRPHTRIDSVWFDRVTPYQKIMSVQIDWSIL